MRESVPSRLPQNFPFFSYYCARQVASSKFLRRTLLATALKPPVQSVHDRALSFILPRMRDQGAPREPYFKKSHACAVATDSVQRIRSGHNESDTGLNRYLREIGQIPLLTS